MNRAVVLLVAAAALAACATREGYEQSLNGWIGHTSVELAASWGAPTGRQELADGGTVLTYDIERSRIVQTGALVQPTTVYVKGTPDKGGPGASYGTSTGYVIGVPPARVAMECVTTFTADRAGKITGWTAEGNDCRT
ncbi:MAG: hypothetical protein ACM3N5_15840 [Candidatus Eiseniibacteriota bacterium]